MRLSDDQKNGETPDEHTQEVLDYLGAENEYLNASVKHTKGLQTMLYDEIIGRIKKDDQSVPVTYRGYCYYTQYVEGDDYPLYCRKNLENNSEEQIVLNVPVLAKGFSYYGVRSRSVSPNNAFIAYGVDTLSRR